MIIFSNGKKLSDEDFRKLQASYSIVRGKEGNEHVVLGGIDEFIEIVVQEVYDSNLAFRRIAHHKGWWMHWTGKAWAEQDDTALMNDLRQLLAGFNQNDRKLTEIRWTLANRVAVSHKSFDAKPMLATDSGVWFVEDGKMQARDYIKEDYNTQLLSYRVDTKPSEKWQAVLDSVLPDETDQKVLQKMFGVCLFTCFYPQCFFHLYGPGGSGKSTIVTVLERIIGENTTRVSAAVLGDADRNNFALATLVPSWVNFDTESERISKTGEKLMKKISGGDLVEINIKNIPQFTVRLNTKLLLTANDMVSWHDKTSALWQRLVLIPFLTQQTGKKSPKEWADGLEPEFPKIIGWAFLGVRDLLQNITNGKFRNEAFDMSDTAKELLQDNRESNNPLLLWVDETCEFGNKNIFLKHEVYREYKEWCLARGHRVCAENTFGRELRQAFPTIMESRQRIGGQRPRQWIGFNSVADLTPVDRVLDRGPGSVDEFIITNPTNILI